MAIEYRNNIAGKICVNPDCNNWKPLSEFHIHRLSGKPVGDGYKSQCKECINAQKRAKRAANPEHHRQVARAYVEVHREHIQQLKRSHQKNHPERYAKSLQKYRETHRTEINAKARIRRNANLDYYRSIGRASRTKHQEERNAYQRAYNKAFPEKIKAAANRYRVRKFLAEGSHSIEEWETLKAHYSYTCLCCHKQEPEIRLTKDHIIPLEKGGSDWISNIQPLCASCNSKKGTKSDDYRS